MSKERLLDPKFLGTGLEQMIRAIQSQVIGQSEAVEVIVNAYMRWLVGLSPDHKPVSTLLFVGPTGSGKTHAMRMATKAITGSEASLIRVDCGEYQHSHEVAKLLGSPPGYLGHRETAPLITTKSLAAAQTDQCKMNFVLFDEVDKAHPNVLAALLGILDSGSLRLGDNSQVDFSNVLIVMTANTGSREIAQDLRGGWGLVGTSHAVSAVGLGAARKALTPEFFNRLTKVVVFAPLSREEIRRILDLEILNLQSKITNGKIPFLFTVSEEAREWLAQQGYDPRYGARHLQRSVDQKLAIPFSVMLASRQIRAGDMIRVDLGPEDLSFMSFEEVR